MSDDKKLRWGIITAGKIAHKFVRGLLRSRTGKPQAVAARDLERAEKFAEEFGLESAYDSYQAVIDDPEVDVVYIGTPHPMHAEWAVAAARGGKHVLCEKPIGMNRAEAGEIIEAAAENDVFLMEAFMYRCHPQTARLVELLREQAVGRVRMVRAVFGYRGTYDLQGLKLNKSLGGGAILDVGCYPVSISRLVAGAALGEEFSEPVEVRGMARFGPESGVDEYAAALMLFPGEIIAQLATGIQLEQDNTVVVFGDEGRIVVESPWFCSGMEGGVSRILVHRRDSDEPRIVEVSTDQWLYGIEADTVAAGIEQRQASHPAMSWEDTLGNMKALDRWRESVGLAYEADRTGR